MSSPIPSPEPAVLFRPSKKRKIYRQRANDESESSLVTTPVPTPAPAPAEQSIDELISAASTTAEAEGLEDPSISEVLRLRKPKKRVGGVEFRPEGHGSSLRDEMAKAGEVARVGDSDGVEVEAGADTEGGGVAIRKFAPQTGTVGDVNKHMMAFIDSELAKRRSEGLALAASQTQSALPTRIHSSPSWNAIPEKESRHGKVGNTDVERQPAALGKLQEIDLGDEVRSRNVEETERARRRLDGEVVDEAPTGKKGKVRLGRDGKPFRSRKRRGSDDVKRDKLVEDVLRENRLEIYDEPVNEEQAAIDDDQAADDRIAEAFRKEFMDAVSARQRKKAAPAAAPSRGPGGKKEEEVLKGPKLGGSRSARAAMRETMLKSAKK